MVFTWLWIRNGVELHSWSLIVFGLLGFFCSGTLFEVMSFSDDSSGGALVMNGQNSIDSRILY